VKSSRRKILRWESGAPPVNTLDELAREEPLEIRVDNQRLSVTMRTPGHDRELAAGFLLGEGLIDRREQIVDIAPYARNKEKNVINVFLTPDTAVDFGRLTRHVFVSSSCGLCGKTSIEAVHQHFPPVKTKLTVAAEVLLQLPEKLRHKQATFDRTGGLHGAGLFDAEGGLIVVREDVGRHNAVDKVLGFGLLGGLFPFDHHILQVSGRVSFEIMQKALAGRVPIVAAVSAPSDLAVKFAQASGQTLIGFVRGTRLNVYSHPNRVRFS
jgi:FdhD protein